MIIKINGKLQPKNVMKAIVVENVKDPDRTYPVSEALIEMAEVPPPIGTVLFEGYDDTGIPIQVLQVIGVAYELHSQLSDPDIMIKILYKVVELNISGSTNIKGGGDAKSFSVN
jgi:hypothetical protein